MPATQERQKRVHCGCTACGRKSYLQSDGREVLGQLVSPTTRYVHERKDRQYQQLNEEDPSVQEVSYDDDNCLDDLLELLEDLQLDNIVCRVNQLVRLLAAWLHLKGGASRAATNTVLKSLNFILDIVFAPLSKVVETINYPFTPPNIPFDVRTVLKDLDLVPDIQRTASCPKCFTQYPIDNVPDLCTHKGDTKKGRYCKEPMKELRRRGDVMKEVPKRVFSTQSLEDWLKFFLSRPGVEDLMDKSYTVSETQNGDIRSTWESPGWHSIHEFPIQAGNLVFGLYIDWFNPFTNKTAGKVISCGALVLCCLHLDPDIRYLPENVFIAGIMPGPSKPAVLDLPNILAHVTDQVLPLWDGKQIRTYRHPSGNTKRVAIVPLIADLEAARMASGFLSHSATLFCSWCMATKTEVGIWGKIWPARRSDTVREQVQKWKATDKVEDRKQLATEQGVRWTPLHDLPNWEAQSVTNVTLGCMHNTAHGYLQSHLRLKWNIEVEPAEDDYALEGDFDELQSELASERDSLQSSTEEEENEFMEGYLADASGQETSSSSSSSNKTARPPPRDPLEHYFGRKLADTDYDPDYQQPPSNVFSEEQVAAIRACISHIPLPSHVQRPPKNLGEPSHGKLKAAEYHLLFTVIFPVIVPELWSTDQASEQHTQLLDNLYHLVASTNIIMAYSTSNDEAEAYRYHYVEYRRSSADLFPYYTSKPNDHYALHNDMMLKFWGPMPLISEMAGEQLNGKFQKILTNNKIYELDYTMLRHMCTLGRLQALVNGYLSDSRELQTFTKILFPIPTTSINAHNRHLTSTEMAKIRTKSIQLQKNDADDYWDHYTPILSYLRAREPRKNWRRWDNEPHPQNSNILPSLGKPLKRFHHDGVTFSRHDVHDGNSAIQFRNYNGTALLTGYIHSIFEIPLSGTARIFLFVKVHKALDETNALRSPFATRLRFKTTIMDAEPSGTVRVIEPSHIVTHVVVYRRPAGEKPYGIQRDVLVVCAGLDRNRRKF